MYKRIAFLAAIFMSGFVPAGAYLYGGTNLSYSGYPDFQDFYDYSPSAESVGRYVDEAQEYVENCDNDIQRILEAREDAIRKANEAVEDYNRSRY